MKKILNVILVVITLQKNYLYNIFDYTVKHFVPDVFKMRYFDQCSRLRLYIIQIQTTKLNNMYEHKLKVKHLKCKLKIKYRKFD